MDVPLASCSLETKADLRLRKMLHAAFQRRTILSGNLRRQIRSNVFVANTKTFILTKATYAKYMAAIECIISVFFFGKIWFVPFIHYMYVSHTENTENRRRQQKSWIREKALGEWRRLYCCVVVQILPYIFNKCILCILKGLLDLKYKCAVWCICHDVNKSRSINLEVL